MGGIKVVKSFRYAVKSAVAIGLMFGTMSGFAYAGGITLNANFIERFSYEACLTHSYSSNRYCELAIMTGNAMSSANYVGFASGTISPYTEMRLRRQVSGRYAFSHGIVYNGGAPFSGIATSSTTQHKNN